jgi:hypothetical protein
MKPAEANSLMTWTDPPEMEPEFFREADDNPAASSRNAKFNLRTALLSAGFKNCARARQLHQTCDNH